MKLIKSDLLLLSSKTRYTCVFSLIFFLLAASNLFADTHSEHQHHRAEESVQMDLNNGLKWETDQPLRSGMAKIQSEINAFYEKIHHNRMKPQEYKTLSNSIEFELGLIFKNCKLSPKADQMLHNILIKIIEGNKAMKMEKDNNLRQKGAIQIINALSVYGKFFDHPNWK